MTEPVLEITVTTAEDEVITYSRAENGYWWATQKGMPDSWMLSRVASRAVDEIVRLREDSELLDWCDTLPGGMIVSGDAAHPQAMQMTPKAPGFSHTRDLIRQARESRKKV